MQELRLVAVSEDGTYVVLAQPGRGTRFALPNDERLRAVVRGQFSRLAQYEIEVESPLRPKEIQARIRAGETAEEIADAAGVPVERVRWFEGPVLAERAYMAQQAQTASVRRPGDPGPGPQLGEIVAARLRSLGADPDQAQWDARKRGDGSWLVELTSEIGTERRQASWIFDPRRRHAVPDDDLAARLSLPDDALAAAGMSTSPSPGARGRGNVTPFAPRPSPAAVRPGTADPPKAGSSAPDGEAAASARAAAPDPVAAQELIRAAAAASGRPADTEAPALRRRPARVDPQPSPSDIPRLRDHVPPAPKPLAAHDPPRAAGPYAPAAGTTTGAAGTPTGAADPAVTEDHPAEEAQNSPERIRPSRKAAGGRGRRASVPTWDEIMFGSSRRED